MIPYTVNETILASTNVTAFKGDLPSHYYLELDAAQRLLDKGRNGTLKRLSTVDCINGYGAQFQSRWSDVIMVTNETINEPESKISSPGQFIASNRCGTYLPSYC